MLYCIVAQVMDIYIYIYVYFQIKSVLLSPVNLYSETNLNDLNCHKEKIVLKTYYYKMNQ